MSKIKSFVITLTGALLCVALAGCYEDPAVDAELEQVEAELRQQQEAERAEMETLRVTLREAAAQRIDLCGKNLADAEKDEAACVKDLASFDEEIKSIFLQKDAKGKDLKHEVKLLNALRSDKINEIALKYLGQGFHMTIDSFIEEIRQARKEEQRYKKAIAAADEDYRTASANTKDWVSSVKKNRESEITRLKSEIRSLEAKREKLREQAKNLSKFTMTGPVDHHRYHCLPSTAEKNDKAAAINHKMSDIDYELTRKRTQLDSLLHPESALAEERQASANIQAAKSRIDFDHQNRLNTIERTMKPKASVAEVIRRYEDKTLNSLKDSIAEATKSATTRKTQNQEVIKRMNDIIISLPTADLRTLRKTKGMLSM